MAKTIKEINEKIRSGGVVVVTAEEVIDLVERKGIKETARHVDVVTTGTFGPMCSSGVYLNVGHSKPKIKLGGGHATLNGVEVSSTDNAAPTATWPPWMSAALLTATIIVLLSATHIYREQIFGEASQLRHPLKFLTNINVASGYNRLYTVMACTEKVLTGRRSDADPIQTSHKRNVVATTPITGLFRAFQPGGLKAGI